MDRYLTISEVAVNWNISERRVQMMCSAGEIEGAMKFGRSWAIPADAERPEDHRLMQFRTYASGRKGFSLVELVVVIAIMGVLVGVLAPSLLRYVEKARMQKDDSAMSEYTHATVISLAGEDAFKEMTAIAEETGNATIRLIFTPNNKVMTVDEAFFADGENILTAAPAIADDLKSSIAESVVLTSTTLSDCPYTIETSISADGLVTVIGYWGLAVNSDLNVLNRDNELQTIFEAMMSAAGANLGTTYKFKVYNSTYTRNNSAISSINRALGNLGDDTDIKTWSIINDVERKGNAYDTTNISYLISTVDISNAYEWNAGDQVPAILQKADGTIEVGMATLYEQLDGTSPYYVISRDANQKYAENADYDINTVLTNKKTFDSLDAAYSYYETLSVIKTQ